MHKKKPDVTTTVEVMENEITVGLHYSAMYQEAKTYGPPEDCYPEDSEMDLWSIEIPAQLPEGVTKELVMEECEREIERLEELCWDHFHRHAED